MGAGGAIVLLKQYRMFVDLLGESLRIFGLKFIRAVHCRSTAPALLAYSGQVKSSRRRTIVVDLLFVYARWVLAYAVTEGQIRGRGMVGYGC